VTFRVTAIRNMAEDHGTPPGGNSERPETMQAREDVEFIGIPEWCRRVGCSRDSGYRAAGWNDISGVFYSPFAIRGESHRLRQAVPNSIPHA